MNLKKGDKFQEYFKQDFEMLAAYDTGLYSYEDAYLFCFKSARRIVYGWN